MLSHYAKLLLRRSKIRTETIICQHSTEACTSSSHHIDYSFSDEILRDSSDKFDSYCNEFVHRISQELIEAQRMNRKINEVKKALNDCLATKNAYIVPIGSGANHLLTKSSDLDLVLLPSKDEIKWKQFMKEFYSSEGFKTWYMRVISDRIRSKHINASKIHSFSNTRIPIIRFTTKNNLQVDIQFGNIEPIRSTLFIRTCVEQDERIRMVIFWLNEQFKAAGILNSARRQFSRYHVNILVLHFLQAMPYSVLPDIISVCPWLRVTNKWNNVVNILGKQGSLYVPSNSAPNEDSIGSIIVKMVDYFSQVDFNNYAINTRGKLLERRNRSVSVEFVDEYFQESTCRVENGAHILKQLFTELKQAISDRNYARIFK